MLCILSSSQLMTDMIPRLSLPLRLKLSFAKLNYMNGHFLSWKCAIIYASLIYGVVHIKHISVIEQVCRLYNRNFFFFFRTHCEPHTEMLLEI